MRGAATVCGALINNSYSDVEVVYCCDAWGKMWGRWLAGSSYHPNRYCSSFLSPSMSLIASVLFAKPQTASGVIIDIPGSK